MTRDEEVQYEQDDLGNERRKLDTIRAKRGNVGTDDDTGLVEVTSAETGTDLLLQSLPSDISEVYVTQVSAFNSVPSGDNAFHLLEVTLDGSGSITASTRRSVPIVVDSATTRFESYDGAAFDKAIGVNADFEGYVGVGFVSDHKEYEEHTVEQ